MIIHSFQFVILFVFVPLVVTSAFPGNLLDKSSTSYVFQSSDRSYLADLEHPRVSFSVSGNFDEAASNGDKRLVTVIYTDQRLVNKDVLEDLVTRYREQDDVYFEAFLEGVYISSTSKDKAVLHHSALEFLAKSNTKYLFVDASSFSYSTNITGPYIITYVKTEEAVKKKATVTPDSAEGVAKQIVLSQKNALPVNYLPPGPYVAKIDRNAVTLSAVYRLYPDDYSDFLFGAYEIGDDDRGSFRAVNIFEPKFGKTLIPVPSRIYSWNDERSLAGQRVAIKDLYDVKGLQTAGGSSAWAAITPAANVSAPSVQQIIDLGGVIIGKYKTAQFAGGEPWDWTDVHYPFNPRGDGQLTCSGSSSGGGCAIAAYEWLDFAIGSDTGSSMRMPAAVSGTYGNRPSQGLMNLEGVLPLSEAFDTAGVFARDPIKWIKFAKAWYQPFLHQPVSVTGLSPLVVPDTAAFPKRLLYLTNYLPLANPAAESLLQQFIAKVAAIFELEVSKFDLISAVKSANTTPPMQDIINLNTIDNILDGKGQWDSIARPLITKWATLYDGRFPPIEITWRSSWQNYSTFNISDEERNVRYTRGLQMKKMATDWFENHVLVETEESCSESIMIYDIGMQGLPEYRDEKSNNDTGTFAHHNENDGKERWEAMKELWSPSICPSFGCVDFTLPIGQVRYRSNVTFVEEMIPVTVSLVARRGCDFMLFNMVERLVREDVLKTVKTGREAF